MKQLRIFQVVCWRNDGSGGGLDDNWIVRAQNHKRAVGYVMAASGVEISEISLIYEIGVDLGVKSTEEWGGVIAGPYKAFGSNSGMWRSWEPCEDESKWTLALEHFVERPWPVDAVNV
ncbi:MAG: hypothetical protein AAF911_02720 [Planctomycetota bacterium]